ncbi:Cloroperoxidase [Cylindrobasidium torrendii FP15055 ss-10]|uniref:Cloroperoxidase n=1 Tax=Cylindrobasidium torrendii FP15055 ss-10 TaxID=1314674 RepID=A0A0D7BMG8_9AGAR|nr:Cloroperoxidase [Cylindrobasidium torrendii FP15055 ss-10]
MPSFTTTLQLVAIIFWDIGLALYNLVAPKYKPGCVVPLGQPGAGGVWPAYVKPKPGDSRGSCPALNALANHGILPHDGKAITFTELSRVIETTYNFAPSFCRLVPLFAADMLGKSYTKDTFDLAELDKHNGIEHDASLTRKDSYHVPDQSEPYVPYIEELLSYASGTAEDGSELLMPDDISRFAAKRRLEAPKENPNFSLEFIHKFFGSSNASTMVTIFGGRISDLEIMLLEERIPDGWESRILKRKGLTMQAFNNTVLKVERNTKKIMAAVAAHGDQVAADSEEHGKQG